MDGRHISLLLDCSHNLSGRLKGEIVQDFMTMGKQYRETLETSQDFSFWRGLVEDLDISAIVGEEVQGRYIEFLVFGKTRKRFYLTTEPNGEVGEQSKKVLKKANLCISGALR